MLLFVLLMESAMPSAQNSVILLQVGGFTVSALGSCARYAASWTVLLLGCCSDRVSCMECVFSGGSYL